MLKKLSLSTSILFSLQLNAAEPQKSWIKDRVEKAEERLKKTDSGKKLWQSIEAHGGLATWYGNGMLSFEYDYKTVDGKRRFDTKQIVDTWSAKAAHELTDDTKVRFGWDGKVAWKIDKKNSLKINPRFWSLTPYYFVGIPFVLADEGINISNLPEKTYDGKNYDVLKVTFGNDVGDSPDDYYIVYLDKKDSTVGLIRYVVSYKGFFPDGGQTPESLMEYNGEQIVKGIKFPKSYRSFTFDPKAHKTIDPKAKIDFENVSFVSWDDSLVEKPKEATVVNSF